jgi:hypothetical protein
MNKMNEKQKNFFIGERQPIGFESWMSMSWA